MPIVSDLKTGDILLIQRPSPLAEVIADETGSPYSHVGLVLKEGGTTSVAHSMGDVHTVDLARFKSLGTMDSPGGILVMRHRELFDPAKRSRILDNYKAFEGLPYDADYRWEKDCSFYCSEFVTKLLNTVLDNKIEPAPMDFSRNLNFWNGHFQGRIPQGRPGNSPGRLATDTSFAVVGTLTPGANLGGDSRLARICRTLLSKMF